MAFKRIAVLLIFVMIGLCTAQSGLAKEMKLPPPPGPLADVSIDQHLNDRLPLDLEFLNADGDKIRLGDLFGDKPVVLAFVYYECPMLCTLVLNGVLRTTRAIPSLDIGKDYDMIAISFDPGETPALAKVKKDNYVKQYGREDSESGWHFLTGSDENVKRVADAAGFKYVYDPKSDEYAHASAIMVLTPDGVLSRYLFGIEYSARDLKLALIEAAESKIGSLVDKFLLFCFHYDPVTGKYSLAIMRLLRIFALLTIVTIGGMIFSLLKKEKKNDKLRN